MESTSVVIVGAGPSGLALGLSLAKFEIPSIILEKEPEITDDPRGVYLTGDSVRILSSLGLKDQMEKIGHANQKIVFHKSGFENAPFYTLDTSTDVTQQVLPGGLLQMQPVLEKVMREEVNKSTFCQLRCGATVESQQYKDGLPIIEYRTADGVLKRIQSSWVIGADGKRGVVRKHFLEKSAGIKQVDSSYQYTGTWIAANLHIRLPTPETHPEFPLWGYGFTPEQVYELFWPEGWHFCSPPGKPTASGRFGPYEQRYWRHEFAQNDWEESMDAEALFWDHLTPMITRDKNELGEPFSVGKVTFPQNCIDILRCRPFTFCHKVVNKWFDRRNILIGDAAHVFPPFAGQGIGSGVRDAHQLAWRLFLILSLPNSTEKLAHKLLTAWALERRQGIEDAANLTRVNGMLCNDGENFPFLLLRALDHLLSLIPALPKIPSPMAVIEPAGYKRTKEGFFVSSLNGGGRVAQVYFGSSSGPIFFSDNKLRHGKTAMTLLVIEDGTSSRYSEAIDAIDQAGLDPTVLSKESIVLLYSDKEAAGRAIPDPIPDPDHEIEACFPVSETALTTEQRVDGYDETAYVKRFGKSARFAIIRPDFYVYATARHGNELRRGLSFLKESLE